ncbi:hypothetical protein V0R48_18640 [Pseudomonas alcaligenes]|uniref:hypothetical protein n=1 Tax=Aquipseudomonas alcaligenes TaxID=43263 RepID=UPI002E7C55B2|nr:hypothetical protein [Pseudomonas alcaligenes]MEE1951001.1 hypothetical protein [Pseudomonas alcaligenes]
MHASTERPLKVLTAEHRAQVANFNQTARDLQRMGIRLHRIDLADNRLVINPEGGNRLVRERVISGYQRHPTAGSTRYVVQFQGVTLEWREPISYARPDEYAGITTH